MMIKVKVKLNSGKSDIVNVNGEEYIVSLKSVPEDNKANIELLKLLKKYFKVEVDDIKIIKGKTSKNKLVRIKNGNKI